MSEEGGKRERSADAAADVADAEVGALESATKKQSSGSGSDAHVEEVVGAIRRLKSHTGSSVKAIHGILKDKLSLDEIKKATKAGASSGKLEQRKQSFVVKGESYADPTPKVEILESIGGTGVGVKAKQYIKIKYRGTLKQGGAVFDEGVIGFRVGDGDVIKGLEEGVIGLREGETRKIKVPSKLGYGKRGSGKLIPPDATLIFEVSLTNEEIPAEDEDEDDPEDEDVEEDDGGDHFGGEQDDEPSN